MSQLASTLREAADKNNELLAELRRTDYAPSWLKLNAAFIDDLNAQISSTDKELKKLHQITEDERKDHVDYRDSNFKRYLHKMGGSKGKEKFTSKAEKDESEFLEAWRIHSRLGVIRNRRGRNCRGCERRLLRGLLLAEAMQLQVCRHHSTLLDVYLPSEQFLSPQRPRVLCALAWRRSIQARQRAV
ncbi:hypothetical protein BST61_g688 [Cercospora zeina]